MLASGWEIVNGLSTLVITGAKVVGFFSWRVSKKALDDNEGRKRRATAVEQSGLFTQNLTVYFEAIQAKNMEARISNASGFNSSPCSPSESLFADTRGQLRRLETFAMYVESGLAVVDQDVVQSVASFC